MGVREMGDETEGSLHLSLLAFLSFHSFISLSRNNPSFLLFTMPPPLPPMMSPFLSTALHLAAYQGHSTCVEKLVSVKAKFTQDNEGMTPLMRVCGEKKEKE